MANDIEIINNHLERNFLHLESAAELSSRLKVPIGFIENCLANAWFDTPCAEFPSLRSTRLRDAQEAINDKFKSNHLKNSCKKEFHLEGPDLFGNPDGLHWYQTHFEVFDGIETARFHKQDVDAWVAAIQAVEQVLRSKGQQKRWTDEELQRLKLYRDTHTEAETARHFNVAGSYVRAKLAEMKKSKTPKPPSFWNGLVKQ